MAQIMSVRDRLGFKAVYLEVIVIYIQTRSSDGSCATLSKLTSGTAISQLPHQRLPRPAAITGRCMREPVVMALVLTGSAAMAEVPSVAAFTTSGVVSGTSCFDSSH